VALDILRLAGLDRSDPKDSSLETYAVGSTDPDSIIEAKARSARPDPIRELINGEPVTEAERQAAIADLERQLASDA
jgi:hypothetical protein